MRPVGVGNAELDGAHTEIERGHVREERPDPRMRAVRTHEQVGAVDLRTVHRSVVGRGLVDQDLAGRVDEAQVLPFAPRDREELRLETGLAQRWLAGVLVDVEHPSECPARRDPDEPTLVWDRPEPADRSSPAPLTRDGIVRAAIALADVDGLEAVSLRKVAAKLDAGPMRLYGYLSTKLELLDLMVDAVYGEIGLPDPSGDVRATLRHLANELRAAAHRHEWFADLIGGRPRLGPHALSYLEATMSALLRSSDEDLDAMTIRAEAHPRDLRP